jgi:hypothetical protein
MGDQMKKHGILALVLASACYAPLDAGAATTCTLASLSGTYMTTVSGSYSAVANGALSHLYSAVGQITADGAGKLTGTMTVNSNGNIVRGVAVTGTYTTSSSCTGSTRLNFTGGGGLPLDIFLTGTGFYGVDSDNNTNLTASATQ